MPVDYQIKRTYGRIKYDGKFVWTNCDWDEKDILQIFFYNNPSTKLNQITLAKRLNISKTTLGELDPTELERYYVKKDTDRCPIMYSSISKVPDDVQPEPPADEKIDHFQVCWKEQNESSCYQETLKLGDIFWSDSDGNNIFKLKLIRRKNEIITIDENEKRNNCYIDTEKMIISNINDPLQIHSFVSWLCTLYDHASDRFYNDKKRVYTVLLTTVLRNLEVFGYTVKFQTPNSKDQSMTKLQWDAINQELTWENKEITAVKWTIVSPDGRPLTTEDEITLFLFPLSYFESKHPNIGNLGEVLTKAWVDKAHEGHVQRIYLDSNSVVRKSLPSDIQLHQPNDNLKIWYLDIYILENPDRFPLTDALKKLEEVLQANSGESPCVMLQGNQYAGKTSFHNAVVNDVYCGPAEPRTIVNREHGNDIWVFLPLIYRSTTPDRASSEKIGIKIRLVDSRGFVRGTENQYIKETSDNLKKNLKAILWCHPFKEPGSSNDLLEQNLYDSLCATLEFADFLVKKKYTSQPPQIFLTLTKVDLVKREEEIGDNLIEGNEDILRKAREEVISNLEKIFKNKPQLGYLNEAIYKENGEYKIFFTTTKELRQRSITNKFIEIYNLLRHVAAYAILPQPDIPSLLGSGILQPATNKLQSQIAEDLVSEIEQWNSRRDIDLKALEELENILSSKAGSYIQQFERYTHLIKLVKENTYSAILGRTQNQTLKARIDRWATRGM
jgi:hypothetical protein